ncbi:hypothetical protein B0H13DRAFT_2443031 [Mycena leptocephala]|nr:hypothetical protein B0H13DRAFT_2443031 [Mycena leptocephala]
MEHRLSAVVAEKQQAAINSVLSLEKLHLPVFQHAEETPSEAEREMWQNYNKYEADFSAGDQISDEAAQQRVEHEMDQMGIWDAAALGRQLDEELDASPDLAREDDALLAEVLAALDVSDPFESPDAQLDAQKLAECSVVLEMFLPLTHSAKHRELFEVIAEFRLFPAIRHGKFFCINDPKAIIRMVSFPLFSQFETEIVVQECANPAIRSQFHLYPEVNTNGSVSEIWHGDKLCKQLNPSLLTPMFDAGQGVHYYLDELSQLTDGRFVIPVRWIKVDKFMHVDVYPVELDQENKACVKKEMLRVSAALLKFNFLDLTFKNQIPDWSRIAMDGGFPARMPNPLRAIAKGDPFYTILVDYFSDDVSGNRSKSWNKHLNAYMTNRALPRQLLQTEFYVHFISTSQHASIPEQFKEFQKLIKESNTDPIRVPDNSSPTGCSCYQIVVNCDPSDNPMQAEICSCMGATANHPCRKCNVGGTQADKATDEGYHAMFSSGEPRSKDDILKMVKRQIELACEGNEAELKKTYTASGIKDKHTEYWINDILSQFKKEVSRGVSKDVVTAALKKWVDENYDNVYSAFLTTNGFDPPRDTPIELLHTILLGVLKYLWHSTHTSWTADQKKTFELRLQAANTSGLSIEAIRAGYIVQYANSLIGRQFKILGQCAVFQLYDLVDGNHFRAWKAVGELSALLWFPEIDDMTAYCADLHVAIGNFLDSLAEIDPSKMVTKVKTHLLTHAPSDVRLFGPLLGAITEAFESFNGVFRSCSILSNHRAPSRDIAIQLAAQEGVKHRVAGGSWPLKGEGNETVWTRCGPSARQLMQEQPMLQRLLGWKQPVVLAPGSVTLAPIPVIKGQRGRPTRKAITLRSTQASLAFNCGDYDLDSRWYKCKNTVVQSQEVCDIHSWVVSSSPVPREDAVMGRIVEILQREASTEAVVILEQFAIQPERHELFNMPFLRPKRREEAVFLILKPTNIQFGFNVQHDCSSGTCKPSGKRSVVQERQETQLQESFVEHDPLINQFLINSGSLHNPHLIRRVLPAKLIAPTPLWDDRALLHAQQAERLRTGREVRKIKNAAAAGARKALKNATRKPKATTTRTITAKKVSNAKKASAGSKRKRKDDERGRKAKRQKRHRVVDECDEDDDSDSDSEDNLDPSPAASRRPGLRVRIKVVNYRV